MSRLAKHAVVVVVTAVLAVGFGAGSAQAKDIAWGGSISHAVSK